MYDYFEEVGKAVSKALPSRYEIIGIFGTATIIVFGIFILCYLIKGIIFLIKKIKNKLHHSNDNS